MCHSSICILSYSAHAAVDGCKPNGVHDQFFEGEVPALADLAALESHSGTDLALLCSSDSYAIFSLWLLSSEFDLLSPVPFSILF